MPFEAAKAVAATFCWKIRHALTPLFGNDFPSLCIHPRERTRERTFGRMVIDQAIVENATERANLYRILELRGSPVSIPPRHQPASRSTPARSTPYPIHRPFNRRYATSISSTGSAPEYPDSFCPSPVSPYRNSFTPVNTPRSTDGRGPMHMPVPIPGSHPNISPSRHPHVPGSVSSMSEKIHSDEDPEPASSETDSSIYSSPTTSTASDSASVSVDLSLDGDADDEFPASRRPQKKRPSPRRRIEARATRSAELAREVKAAHALLSLYTQHGASDLGEMPGRSGFVRGRKTRRASA